MLGNRPVYIVISIQSLSCSSDFSFDGESWKVRTFFKNLESIAWYLIVFDKTMLFIRKTHKTFDNNVYKYLLKLRLLFLNGL